MEIWSRGGERRYIEYFAKSSKRKREYEMESKEKVSKFNRETSESDSVSHEHEEVNVWIRGKIFFFFSSQVDYYRVGYPFLVPAIDLRCYRGEPGRGFTCLILCDIEFHK